MDFCHNNFHYTYLLQLMTFLQTFTPWNVNFRACYLKCKVLTLSPLPHLTSTKSCESFMLNEFNEWLFFNAWVRGSLTSLHSQTLATNNILVRLIFHQMLINCMGVIWKIIDQFLCCDGSIGWAHHVNNFHLELWTFPKFTFKKNFSLFNHVWNIWKIYLTKWH